MYLRLLSAVVFVALSARAQAPDGRWDGMLQVGPLKVPFRVDFEGSLKGALVNGDARLPSTSGSFADPKVMLSFETATLEGTLADGQLKGTIKSASGETYPFTAGRFCTCGFEGEAGPDIAGTWNVAEAGWTLAIRRVGEDTLVAVTRGGATIGPVTGRFDGLTFFLHYFDGLRMALLEIEQSKQGGGLDLVWTEPGQGSKKFKASKAK